MTVHAVVRNLKESEIQRVILHLLAAEHVFALRINTSSQVLTDGNGRRRFLKSHSGGAGVADIVAFPRFLEKLTNNSGSITRCVSLLVTPTWIEVKSATGKQTPEQKSFQEKVESEGHAYLLARSVDDVINWLREKRLGNYGG